MAFHWAAGFTGGEQGEDFHGAPGFWPDADTGIRAIVYQNAPESTVARETIAVGAWLARGRGEAVLVPTETFALPARLQRGGMAWGSVWRRALSFARILSIFTFEKGRPPWTVP